MLYRIITEDVNPDKTLQLVSDHFSSFTMIGTLGYHKGQTEDSIIIEICDDPDTSVCIGYRVGVLAKLIKVQNKQETVLVQEIDCKSSLI